MSDSLFFVTMPATPFNSITQPSEWKFHEKNTLTLSNGVSIPQAKVSIGADDTPIRFQLNEGLHDGIVAPFGLNAPMPGEAEHKYSLPISISANSVQHQFLKDIDNAMIHAAVQNSTDWFKKKLNEEEVRARYKSLLHESETDEYPDPKSKLKIDSRHVRVHNMVSAPTSEDPAGRFEACQIDSIRPRSHVVVNVEVGKVWFLKSKFGVSLQAVDILITKSGLQKSIVGPLEFDFGSNFTSKYITEEEAAAIESAQNDEPPQKRIKMESIVAEQEVVTG